MAVPDVSTIFVAAAVFAVVDEGAFVVAASVAVPPVFVVEVVVEVAVADDDCGVVC
jgi:hypothetical protein